MLNITLKEQSYLYTENYNALHYFAFCYCDKMLNKSNLRRKGII